MQIVFDGGQGIGYSSLEIYAPNNKVCSFTTSDGRTRDYIALYNTIIRVSDTTITILNGKGMSWRSDNTLGGFANVNGMNICQVIGYK